MLAVIEMVPSQLAGKGSGRVMFGFLLGLATGAPIVGYIVDIVGSYSIGWSLALGLFAVGAASVRPDRPNRHAQPIS